MADELFILWTNADEVTFDKMVVMYARNSMLKQWWDKVTLIVWGNTANLAAGSSAVREGIRHLKEAGVVVTACKSCADQLGVTDKLEAQGIEVKYWGEPLTRLLKENQRLLTV
jgi:hypothetical protein